jgi:hypothetical protein
MLTGFLVMLWSAIHSGDAPMTRRRTKQDPSKIYEAAFYSALAHGMSEAKADAYATRKAEAAR